MVLDSVSNKTRRLFFAVWPDAAARTELSALVRRLKSDIRARWLPPEQWHLTLAFLGAVAAERLPEAQACVDKLRAEAGELVLDRIEYWRRSGVICLTPSQAPSALNDLARDLVGALRQVDFALEERPFRAHLTLVRKVVLAPVEYPRFVPISMSYDALTLVESIATHQGSQYRILHSWPLLSRDQAMPDDKPME